jgi:hypothetical protein
MSRKLLGCNRDEDSDWQRPTEEIDMAELPHHPESDDDAGVGSDHGSSIRTRWTTYLFVIVGVALVLVMVVLHLAGIVGPGTN